MQSPVIAIVDDDESVCIGMTEPRAFARIRRADLRFGRGFSRLRGARDDTSCLISDVQMPGLGGLELQKILAAEGSQLPIIFITAFPDPRIRQAALRPAPCVFSASHSMAAP